MLVDSLVGTAETMRAVNSMGLTNLELPNHCFQNACCSVSLKIPLRGSRMSSSTSFCL